MIRRSQVLGFIFLFGSAYRERGGQKSLLCPGGSSCPGYSGWSFGPRPCGHLSLPKVPRSEPRAAKTPPGAAPRFPKSNSRSLEQPPRVTRGRPESPPRATRQPPRATRDRENCSTAGAKRMYASHTSLPDRGRQRRAKSDPHP